MSYPSVTWFLDRRTVDLDTASEDVLQDVLFEAMKADLNLGMQQIELMAQTIRRTRVRGRQSFNPSSDVGKQIVRLLGTDIARAVIERQLGVAFGLYNCCTVVGAPEKEMLKMSIQEQIKLQNGELASPDC